METRITTQNEPEITPLETEILDRSNPRSVVTLAPDAIGDAIEVLAHEHPELLNVDEDEILVRIKNQVALGRLRKDASRIGKTKVRLRVAFWNEYNRAQESNRKIYSVNITVGVCNRKYFENDVLTNPAKLAWILTPPTSYTNAMEEALITGIERMREILTMSLETAKGDKDYKAAELILKTVQYLDMRVKGATIQRVDSRSVVVHANAKPRDSQPMSLEDVQNQINSLEHQARSILNGKVVHESTDTAVEVLPPEGT